MSAELFAGLTNIANNADKPPARNKNAEDFLPHLVQLMQEDLIVVNMSHLVQVIIISFEVPIGRGSYHQVNGFLLDKSEIASVTENELLSGRFSVKGVRWHDSIRIA
jgi:hypothetical protein